MSAPVILNLDWGSYFLKASARMYHRRVLNPVGPSWQLAGKPVGRKLEGHQSLRHSAELSLKSAFLGGRIEESGLGGHVVAAESQIADRITMPLLRKIQAYHPQGAQIHVNIHTPLQMQDPSQVDPDIFEVVDAHERLVGLRYAEPDIWRRASRRTGATRELVWGTWLMERLLTGLKGASNLSVRIALMPESLACVHELVGQLETNEDRQVVVLDIGDFTTDFALVAAHNLHDQQRMVIRQAGSIYHTGHQVLKVNGFSTWLEALMKALHLRFDPSHPKRGIHAYCDLAVLLVGGGAASLTPTQQESLRLRIQDWASRKPYFLEHHRAFLVFPSRRSEAFQVLADPQAQTLDMQTTDLTVHVPARNACVFADTTLSLRVAGHGPL
ncbi:MAG: hypothetical protein IPF72_20185 [Chitinophagaceae bacterium]|nr:hypothetical protein [Chitinophagaceae bacterium]